MPLYDHLLFKVALLGRIDECATSDMVVAAEARDDVLLDRHNLLSHHVVIPVVLRRRLGSALAPSHYLLIRVILQRR